MLNEDITSALLEDIEDDKVPSEQKALLLDSIFKIFSDFWFNECVPRDFKRTVLRPFLKSSDKDCCDPSNYRPISLLNTLMKVYEGIICKRLICFLEEKKILSPLQAAYRRGRSSFDHIFTLHELFLEYRFNKKGPRGGLYKKKLFFCFLDLKKAFDSVLREILFFKLYRAGIRGKLFRVIKNLFSSNPANVLVDNFLSPKFTIDRGVLQGSKLGPILFNLFINDLLDDLLKSNLGAAIGKIHIPGLGFADDIVLISDCPQKLQGLINVCERWADKNSMAFNIDKCKVMVLNGSHKTDAFTLNGDKLDIVDSHMYLGVTLTSSYVSNLFRTHFSLVMDRAKVKAAIIRKHGFHEDGLRISTAIKLHKLVIRPLLEYCAQTLSYNRYCNPVRLDATSDYTKELEHCQTQILKALISCPQSTSPSIVRLFCGTEPIACRLDILKLRYYWKVLKSPTDSLAHTILEYRKINFLDFNKGLVHEAFNICCKYNILHYWHGVAPAGFGRNNAVSSIVNPFRRMKATIISHNLGKDLEIGRSRNCSFSLLYLRNVFSYQKDYHLIAPFRQPDCFATPKGRKHFLRAFLDPCTYSQDCKLCGQSCYDRLDHLLVTCSRTVEFRNELHLKLALYNFPKQRLPLKKIEFWDAAFTRRIWRKSTVKFLLDINF